jgi:UDP-N-acetylglucosamine--N-acetylmuramyl-(pentapeptide) pyrophosphoryl-undecaprenol N-acetylglucosamine transferase
MAGGTGGHIFPALTVAHILRSQGWRITWLGGPDSMEAELVPRHGYKVEQINFSGVRGTGLMRKLLLPLSLSIALLQSLWVMLKYRPDVVLGMGGYITLPGGLAAWLTRRPLVIHEQNSVAGMSNRVLARFSKKVLSGFPDVLPQAVWCGNPVRGNIAELPEPELRYRSRSGRLNVLVVGGSLGAHAINEAMPKALALLPDDVRPHVTHQTGKKNFASVQMLYQQSGIRAEIKPFLDDMSEYYGSADVVVCRAGALTVAELAAAGVASVLIPFPFAVDDHQTHNARFLSVCGAAVLLPQSELNPERLAQLLRDMDRTKLLEMAQQARSLAQPAAALAVARVCKELAR